MSQSGLDQAAGGENTGKKAFRRKGFLVFGLGFQDAIRIFFGGNASLAIVILILICAFLAKEAFMFFPDHHEGLNSYRKSGQEFVDYIGDEVDAHTALYSAANIAYYAEVNRTSQEEDSTLRVYRALLANVEKLTSKTWGRFERELDAVEDIDDELEDLDPERAEDRQKALEIQKERDRLLAEITKLRVMLKEEVASAIRSESLWDLGTGTKEPKSSVRARLLESIIFEGSPEAEKEHPYIIGLKQVAKEKKAKAAEELIAYKGTLKAIQASIRPLKSLQSDLKKVASENKSAIVSFSTAPARREAWLEGSTKTDNPEEKARMLAKADEVLIREPDYTAMNATFYNSVATHAELIAPLELKTRKLYEQLPAHNEVATQSGRENLMRADHLFESFEANVETSREEIKNWRHEKKVSAAESVTSFLFGRDWITNSSWHDFYGLLPLFTGSLLISIIAIVVAVPFAISAAIYVNQLAPIREQNLVKPAIEFIGAIPSVVLGFFGILVFGETLRAVSQVEWLQWVPGFPMAERLTILNAGLLLAFMAIPTIFTLTEDALNNIPQSLTENSLAMGATQLQTVFRVIVPTAISGIIAAVLLGFGRIIGETMVVLLVAGNKIKIPDFTEGIGVIAQPAHTMTGIIAQELGEVDSGSLHWRALFMVGMVLFVISLLVNFSAQRVLKKLQKI